MVASPWTVLDIKYGAPMEQVKQRYRRLALIYHPDKNRQPGKEEIVTLKMAQINQAYEQILKIGEDTEAAKIERESTSSSSPGHAFRPFKAPAGNPYFREPKPRPKRHEKPKPGPTPKPFSKTTKPTERPQNLEAEKMMELCGEVKNWATVAEARAEQFLHRYHQGSSTEHLRRIRTVLDAASALRKCAESKASELHERLSNSYYNPDQWWQNLPALRRERDYLYQLAVQGSTLDRELGELHDIGEGDYKIDLDDGGWYAELEKLKKLCGVAENLTRIRTEASKKRNSPFDPVFGASSHFGM